MATRSTSVALIDDDTVFRQALGDLLELSGFAVEQYGSGEDFLNAAPASGAHCLIVDVQLGDITGIEMARQLQALGLRFPLIFMTGSTDEAFSRQADELGCAAFLLKPFRRDVLIEAIMAATVRQSEPEGEAE